MLQPGLGAPPLVCGSVAVIDVEKFASGRGIDFIDRALLDKGETIGLFVQVLRDPDKIIVGASIAYDLAVVAAEWAKRGVDVMPEIFAAFEQERIYDLQVAEALHAVAGGHLGLDPRTMKKLRNRETGRPGSYSLDNCVELVLGRIDAKGDDDYRLQYAQLEKIAMELWPEKARKYPVDDAYNTLETALAQVGHLSNVSALHDWAQHGCTRCGATRFGEPCVSKYPRANLHNHAAQVKSAFALWLGAIWGFSVDQRKVDVVENYYRARRDSGIKPFQEVGLIREDGSMCEAILKKLVAEAYGSVRKCRVCAGRGKVLAPNPRTLQCTACRGRSAPWKSGGTIKPATHGACAACSSTGRVIDVRHQVVCHGEAYEGEDGKIKYAKTCDGTGLELTDAVPRSPTEGVKKDADTLFESSDDFLMSLGDFFADKKALNDYVRFLRKARRPVGGHLPECAKAKFCTCSGPYVSIPLTLKPNSILETGRVSYRDHIQTFKREPGFWIDADEAREFGFDRFGFEITKNGIYIPSFRECIVARPGFVLSSEDFRAGELVTGGQSSKWICGFSDLGTALLSKDSKGRPIDVHAQLAATVLGMKYEEFYDLYKAKDRRCVDTRQASKPTIFGKPGGMGDPKIVSTQRRQGPDTPSEFGNKMIEDEEGNLVRGYKGLRFCILMGGERPCSLEKTYEWNDRPISPVCTACLECAIQISEHWRTTFREYAKNRHYFKFVGDCVDDGQVVTWEMLTRWSWLQEWFRPGQRLAPGQIMQHWSGRLRGGLDFCAMANGFFQGLLADISKEAYWQVQRECYDRTYRVPRLMHENSKPSRYAGGQSPLYGSRAIGFLHDEFLNEHPRSVASDASCRVSEVMVDKMRWICPDYADAAEADPTLMLAWDKRAAKVVHNDNIVPWTPDHNAKKCGECKAQSARDEVRKAAA